METIWSSAQCGFQRWNEIWGDPLLSGSLKTFGYLLVGYFLWSGRRNLQKRERFLWAMCSIIMVLLAINTPLDLHAFGWTFGKCLAVALDVYDAKREIQFAALAVLAGTTTIVGLILAVFFRRVLLRNVLLLMGVFMTVGIIIVEAISNHELAAYYGKNLGLFYVQDLIELAGIALVLAAVRIHLHRFSRIRHGDP